MGSNSSVSRVSPATQSAAVQPVMQEGRTRYCGDIRFVRRMEVPLDSIQLRQAPEKWATSSGKAGYAMRRSVRNRRFNAAKLFNLAVRLFALQDRKQVPTVTVCPVDELENLVKAINIIIIRLVRGEEGFGSGKIVKLVHQATSGVPTDYKRIYACNIREVDTLHLNVSIVLADYLTAYRNYTGMLNAARNIICHPERFSGMSEYRTALLNIEESLYKFIIAFMVIDYLN